MAEGFQPWECLAEPVEIGLLRGWQAGPQQQQLSCTAEKSSLCLCNLTVDRSVCAVWSQRDQTCFFWGDSVPLEFWEMTEPSWEVSLLTLRQCSLSCWHEGRRLWSDWMDRLAARLPGVAWKSSECWRQLSFPFLAVSGGSGAACETSTLILTCPLRLI